MCLHEESESFKLALRILEAAGAVTVTREDYEDTIKSNYNEIVALRHCGEDCPLPSSSVETSLALRILQNDHTPDSLRLFIIEKLSSESLKEVLLESMQLKVTDTQHSAACAKFESLYPTINTKVTAEEVISANAHSMSRLNP